MKLEKACILTKEIAETEETKREARTKPSYFTRIRKMSFSALVYFILHPGKESTRLGLTRFFKLIGKAGFKMSEQAFSEARSHFSHWPFEKMVRETTAEEYHSEDTQTWNGYYWFAIDGTTQPVEKASQSSRLARREWPKSIFPAACTPEKYFSARKCANRPPSADNSCAQRAAAFSKKWLRHFFDSLKRGAYGSPLYGPVS